jgi:hypothetical protein
VLLTEAERSPRFLLHEAEEGLTEAERSPRFLLHEVEEGRWRPAILPDRRCDGDRDSAATSSCPSPLRGEGTGEGLQLIMRFEA